MAGLLSLLPKPKNDGNSTLGYRPPAPKASDSLGPVKEPPPYGRRDGYVPRK